MAAHTPPPDPPEWDENPGGHELFDDAPLDAVHDSDGTVDSAHRAHEDTGSGAWPRLQHRPPSGLARIWWEMRGLVYLSAFVLPILVLIAFLVLLNALGISNDDDAEDTSTRPTLATTHTASGPPTEIPTLPPNPEWPAAVTFTSHSTPARIRNTLNGGAHGYAFWGEAGHVWLITAEPTGDSTLDPKLALYDPAGKLICFDDDCLTGATRAQIATILPDSGIYRLVVDSASGTNAGTYLLTLQVD